MLKHNLICYKFDHNIVIPIKLLFCLAEMEDEDGTCLFDVLW